MQAHAAPPQPLFKKRNRQRHPIIGKWGPLGRQKVFGHQNEFGRTTMTKTAFG